MVVRLVGTTRGDSSLQWFLRTVLLSFALERQKHLFSHAFIAFPSSTRPLRSFLRLRAKPSRLEENAEGVLYVNDKCINCAACANFAPGSFRRGDENRYHVVYHQPASESEIVKARAALAACPVAAIRVETLAERKHSSAADDRAAVEAAWDEEQQSLVDALGMNPKRNGGREKPFPRSLLEGSRGGHNDDIDAYYLGHHNDQSFGACPYLVKARHGGRDLWIMVDTPRYSKSAVDAVTGLTGPSGPDYLFLTHVDDTADHGRWAERFGGGLRRVFHEGDLGPNNWIGDTTLEDVEILLLEQHRDDGTDVPATSSNLAAYSLDGEPLSAEDWMREDADSGDSDVVILHTPGHSPGSITLYLRPSERQRRPGIVFTGDTYAFTTRTDEMTGLPVYGNDLRTQADSLKKLTDLDWEIVAPGHGHPRDYRGVGDSKSQRKAIRKEEMGAALDELAANPKW